MPMLWFREIITSAILIHLIQVYQNQFDSTTLTTFVRAYLYFWHFYHAETEGGCRDKVMHRDTIYISFIYYTKRAGYLTICTMYSLQNMKHAAVDSWKIMIGTGNIVLVHDGLANVYFYNSLKKIFLKIFLYFLSE